MSDRSSDQTAHVSRLDCSVTCHSATSAEPGPSALGAGPIRSGKGHTLRRDCRRCQPTETRFADLKKAALAAEVLAGRSARGNSAYANLVSHMWQEMAERVVVRVGDTTAATGTTPPTNAAAPAATGAARLLPAGTRVLVQRLVAKPEHNGKRARVVSFDARTGRYAVSLDDGKELSLKAECVARAGCAAAGCASAEASSVCARCEAVRYCSRECQRTDWKAHKPVCTAAPP